MRYIVLVTWWCWLGQGLGSSSDLTDFLGCFTDSRNSKVNDASNHFLRYNNSRITCKEFCKQENTRYAGTKDGVWCLCGNNLVSSRKVGNDFCNVFCPNVHEHGKFCGGKKSIQVYDLWPCRNGAWCNGHTCQDINGTDYRCKCSDGLTGKYCNETTTEPPTTITTTPLTKTTTSTIQIVNISSTIIGHGTEPTISESSTHGNNTNTEDTVFYHKQWFIVTTIVVAIVIVLNCICLAVWCIYKRNKNGNEMEPENTEHKSGIHVISGNQASYEMETLREYGEKGVRCSMDEEIDTYALIDDTDMTTYENLDLANHCEQSERLFSGIYANVN